MSLLSRLLSPTEGKPEDNRSVAFCSVSSGDTSMEIRSMQYYSRATHGFVYSVDAIREESSEKRFFETRIEQMKRRRGSEESSREVRFLCGNRCQTMALESRTTPDIGLRRGQNQSALTPGIHVRTNRQTTSSQRESLS